MTNTNTDKYILATKDWLQQVVIGHNFCPFALKEFKHNRIRYQVIPEKKHAALLNALIQEYYHLDTHPSTETTLIIFPYGLNQFERFLNLLDHANDQLIQHDYEGVYQIASFHPDYCFANADIDDPANYTNRSPYPTLHLIREISLEHVLKKVKTPKAIPERNINHARALGLQAMQLMLQNCYQDNDNK
ncbi:hypothetical protein Psal006b_03067 [Piscirickettsia salmonis]|uniref:Lipoprotein signal peptidase n=1 Tax=Piscirickettsia salmonis TaxID=1238 RepID=A0A1L6TG32_PISSA|nr:DUF1415 domain-containing protein [Piscirickettsia salmonis]AKP74729.1 hypothetical protein PSLF89_3240 [Piscirickettsia salmonis LF-89 = ATCC VR-1361]ALB21345.1 lipoprotein signal peptidase [Piscirickettsia salmonis]ALY01584.1 hypothetical protein AWE47_00790 [Piscirickettsia salmonis]AMA41096.1 hypothetical protein AWJ11_00785 [Piscirickettsia salmonis]AOS36286.1 hypothetical protein AVM72_13780 [Piscirickettsia salmonis]